MPRPERIVTASELAAGVQPIEQRPVLHSEVGCSRCDGRGVIDLDGEHPWLGLGPATTIPCPAPGCVDGRVHPED